MTHTGSVDVKHQFTGQEKDNSTGLHYYNARYYDSQFGRFITSDPTVQHPTDPQDLNRYAYARNNPIKFTDPTGLGWFSKLVGAIIGIVVGVVTTLVTGNVAIGIMAGLAAFRGTEAALNGAKWRETATAAVNGAGEGVAIAKDPRKASGLITNDPQTDSFSKEGRAVVKATFMYFGLDGASAEIATRGVEAGLTTGNRSYAAITGTAELSNDEAIRRDENGIEYDPLPEILLSFGISFAKGVISGFVKGSKGNMSELIKTHSINRTSNKFQNLKLDISKNGIKEPISVVRANGQTYIVDGHHRVAAARELGYNNVPVKEVKLPYKGYRTVDDLQYDY